jgi:hypothetical protein
MTKTVTKQDLDTIRSRAIDKYTTESRETLDDQQFIAKCWLESCAAFLELGNSLQFPAPRKIVEPAEE